MQMSLMQRQEKRNVLQTGHKHYIYKKIQKHKDLNLP